MLTTSQVFSDFLNRLIPLESERSASAMHRASVEASLKKGLAVSMFRDIGSFGHGTALRGRADVDLLVSISTTRPGSSDTALGWVRDALKSSFPSTYVHTSRPAVAVDFAGGDERWEITPAFLTSKGGSSVSIYEIPGASSGWIETAPVEHIKYVNEINGRPGIAGGAKKLARLAKAWKYFNSVPISSFYLEMRAAQYMATQSSFIAYLDFHYLMKNLQDIGLAGMNDPLGHSSRIYPCSTDAKATEAFSKLNSVVSRTTKAVAAEQDNDPSNAYYYFDLAFGGQLPAR